MDDKALTRRALASYFRTGGNIQPSGADSGVRFHDGRAYVVLENINGILKVYRVKNDGALKALRRWPASIEVA